MAFGLEESRSELNNLGVHDRGEISNVQEILAFGNATGNRMMGYNAVSICCCLCISCWPYSLVSTCSDVMLICSGMSDPREKYWSWCMKVMAWLMTPK